MRPFAALAIAGAAIFLTGQARPAPDVARDGRLAELAETLGRQHYLRTLCRGGDDQTWRTRMARLLEVEEPRDAARLEAAFNRGFTALTTRIPACGPAARDEAVANAERGASLAASL